MSHAVPCATMGSKVIPGSSGFSVAAGWITSSVNSDHFCESAACGTQQLMACCSYSGNGHLVLVYDANSLQLVQTLYGHQARVTCVHWKPPPASYLQHGLLLFTGDAEGTVFLWDVGEGIIVNRVQLPCAQPVCTMSFLSERLVSIVTRDMLLYVYDAHLVGTVAVERSTILQTSHTNMLEEAHPTPRFRASKLSQTYTYAVTLGDRFRIISNHDPPRKDTTPSVMDVVCDSEDGPLAIVDVCFSEAQPEVIYFATSHFVGCYDWHLRMMLNEQLLWVPEEVEFCRIFPSAPDSPDDRHCTPPLLYSFGSNQRLVAWYITRGGKFNTFSADVRGARIISKTIANVVQCESDLRTFVVLFVDGGIAKWEFILSRQRWRLMQILPTALVRPVCVSPVSHTRLCCALESGHVVIMDAMYNLPLRRFNLVYSGGTRIVLLCRHRWEESMWIVSNRIINKRNHHQVSLFDIRTGEIIRILRKPSATPEATTMKEISMDPTYTYLLLTFWDGTFEVWNTFDGCLIHVHSGLGVANASWAPGSMRRWLVGVYGVPQLLAVLFSEGAMSIWSVYKDCVKVSRDAMPLFSPTAIGEGPVRSVCAGPNLIFFDRTGGASVLKGLTSTNGELLRLRNVPPLTGPAVSIAAATPYPSQRSGGGMSRSPPVDAGDFGSESLVAVAFTDGSFGVWDSDSGERQSYSGSSRISIAGASVFWLGDELGVLGTNGSVFIMDLMLSSVNSSVTTRALRWPLQNVAFLLPAQRTYVQTALELDTGTADSALMFTVPCRTPPAKTRLPPSFLVQSIECERRPCRGPYGQIITIEIETLQQELELYTRTMVPRRIQQQLRAARQCGSVAAAGFWVARFLGQTEKGRLWAQLMMTNHATGDSTTCSMESISAYPLADRYAEAVADTLILRRNRTALNMQRALVLQVGCGHNFNDTAVRLTISRQLLQLQEHAKAIDVLMDGNYELPNFDRLATLAVAVAASAAASNATSSTSSLFSHTGKQAAAMLLAQGDVHAAVEKYMLAGDWYEACLALQSRGLWSEAAVTGKVSPVSDKIYGDVVCQWAARCAKHGESMPAARLLVSVLHESQALAFLSESASFTDVAGLLAVYISSALSQAPLEKWNETVNPGSTFFTCGSSGESSLPLSLGDVVLNVLMDYGSVLRSIGNTLGECRVRDLIAELNPKVSSARSAVAS